MLMKKNKRYITMTLDYMNDYIIRYEQNMYKLPQPKWR